MNSLRRMNITLIAGVLLGILSIALAIASEIRGNSPLVFFHPVGLMIVLGGSSAASLITLPMHELIRVYQRTYYAIRFPKDDFLEAFREIIKISVGTHRDHMFLQDPKILIQNAMLRDAINLITMGYSTDDIRRFLHRKKEHNESGFIQCSSYFFSISKMGPAFGLLGTLVGLIIVLYFSMGSGNMTRVASSMGVALTATLYGVAFSNLIFGPLAEYMQYIGDKCAQIDELIVQGIILIKERRHPLHIVQALKSYIPREDYIKIDKIVAEENTMTHKQEQNAA